MSPISSTSANPSSSPSSSSHFLKYFKKRPSDPSSNSHSMSQPVVVNGTTDSDNKGCTFTVGVSEDRNRKCRKTMEDAHTYIYNFGGKQDDGYFGVFDGHAGRQAADWSSKKLHTFVEDSLKDPEIKTAAQALNHAFTTADGKMKAEGVNNSGCTAAVAVLRWESNTSAPDKNSDNTDDATSTLSQGRRRTLCVGNAGDTRVVLCRDGKALRLSYDHKGSDAHEAKRIANAGGLMVNNRVNGVLAVTRSLGDNFMKQLVVGAPYTTETILDDKLDDFIIIACDGLWDVCTDEQAVDLIKNTRDPKVASQQLIDYALQHFSSDNLTCMVIRLH